MGLPSDFIILFISLSGVLAGIGLSYLAQEELAAGKKYFVMMYRAIFIMLSFITAYFLSGSLVMMMLFLFSAIFFLALDFRKHHQLMFFIHYLFFLVGYFLSGKELIIAAMLFLYGLPVGTLLRRGDG